MLDKFAMWMEKVLCDVWLCVKSNLMFEWWIARESEYYCKKKDQDMVANVSQVLWFASITSIKIGWSLIIAL
jgi:hypothetical protein